MDGNGRWAQSHELPRIEGHRRGVSTVRMVSEVATEFKIGAVTLYCLSSENWKRPQPELDFLMHLLEQYLVEERRVIMDQGLRLQTIGRRDRLPPAVVTEMDRTIEMSANNPGTKLVLAIDYGGRDELARVMRAFAQQAAHSKLDPIDINEQLISTHLDTGGFPEVDLMIRTGGEMRLSNFLLWQLSYAELYFTNKNWPEFGREDFLCALQEYAARQRRFGGLSVNS